MQDRYLPGVTGVLIEEDFRQARSKEIEEGRFDSRESSSALAVNTFGLFRSRPRDLPPLPSCNDLEWPASSLYFEKKTHFPWTGGKHPQLDVLITAPSALIGVEAKRFEPFRDKPKVCFSDAFWREVWGNYMNGYEGMRDTLHDNESLFAHLKADQLVKHALGLLARTRPEKEYEGLTPTLFYLYAEPNLLPNSNKLIDDKAKALHREEVSKFAQSVEGDEVRFVACSYRDLLATWERSENPEIREHAKAVMQRFSP